MAYESDEGGHALQGAHTCCKDGGHSNDLSQGSAPLRSASTTTANIEG